MKRKIGIIFLLAFIFLVGCGQGGNSGDTSQNIDYDKFYQPIIDEIRNLILSKEDDEEIAYDNIKEEHFGLVSLINSSADMNKGGLIGYAIGNYFGDENPELIIGKIDREFHLDSKSEYQGVYLYEVYSIVDGKVELILGTREYDDFHILDDKTIFKIIPYEDYQLIVNYKFENEKLVPIDIYKTHYDTKTHKMVYYKDKDGDLDTDDFVDMEIGDEAFGELMMEYWYASSTIELKPIVKFEYLSVLIENPEGNYKAYDYYCDVFELEDENDYNDLKKFIVNDGKYSVKAVIEPYQEMKNVEIVELSTYESKEVGIDYNVDRTLYEVGDLSPGQHIMIQLEVPEHFSNVGISFIDYYGEMKYYVIYESGKDGSLGIEEIYPAVG